MAKSHILVANFQKSPSVGSSPPRAHFNLRCWLPEVTRTWFGQIIVFSNWLWKN